MIVVVACPRSGTRFVSKLVARFGVELGHEVPGRDGTVDWHAAADMPPGDKLVCHQVRYPLSVIGSLTTIGKPSWRFMARALRDRLDEDLMAVDDLVLRGMMAWCGWTALCDEHADITWRVEALDGLRLELGLPGNDHSRKHAALYPAQLRERSLTWSRETERRARGYGYPCLVSTGDGDV